MNRFFSLLAAGLMVALVSTAQAAQAPDEVIRSATGSLQGLIAQNHDKYRADKGAFYKMVDETVVPYFDTAYIAQLILARNWKTATPEQRTRFETAFKNMLIRSYADALLQYHDSVKAEIKPAQMAPDAKQATVRTDVLRKDGPPVPLDFKMRLVDGNWKVWDITVENISLVTNFRSQVAAQVKQSSLDAVIQKLESGQQVVAPPATEGSPG